MAFYFFWPLLLLCLVSALPASAQMCQSLPPSTLLIYDATPAKLVESVVPAAGLARQTAPEGGIASQHTMMLTVINVLGFFEIKHRIVPQEANVVCNAPELVRIGFGSSERRILIADKIAGDSCVRRSMLDHEAEHAVALDSTIKQFIDDHRPDFEKGMRALKQTPAPSGEVAKARWNEGLKMLVKEAKDQLKAELHAAFVRVDDPAVLTALELSCDGKLRALSERRLGDP
jgi:hypothetical protein